MKRFLLAVFMLFALPAAAEIQTKAVSYEHDGVKLTGHLYWDDAMEGKRPGVMVVHEWWGLNDYAKKRARMLAELGIFLGTRLPLLTGNFAEVWVSQLLVSPETSKILADIHTFSEVSERFANVAEQLPDRMVKDVSTLQKQMIDQVMREVAVERKAAIDQFMDRLVGENKVALDAVMAQDQQIIGVVNELRQTIEGTNALLLTAGALAEKYDTGEPPAEAKDAKPFDIKEYQATIVEVTKLVESTSVL